MRRFLILSIVTSTSAFCHPSFTYRNFLTRKTFSAKGRPDEDGTHTYVEGLEYTSLESEILAMGGDPAFMAALQEDPLIDEEDLDQTSPSLSFMEAVSLVNAQSQTHGDSESWNPTKGHGPRPTHRPSHEILVGDAFEWDGTVDEDAYFDD